MASWGNEMILLCELNSNNNGSPAESSGTPGTWYKRRTSSRYRWVPLLIRVRKVFRFPVCHYQVYVRIINECGYVSYHMNTIIRATASLRKAEQPVSIQVKALYGIHSSSSRHNTYWN